MIYSKNFLKEFNKNGFFLIKNFYNKSDIQKSLKIFKKNISSIEKKSTWTVKEPGNKLSVYSIKQSDNYLNKVLNNFPDINENNDLRGNNNFYLLNDIEKLDIEKKIFWKDFIKKALPQIVKKLTFKFYKNLSSKFKKIINNRHKLVYGTLMLSRNAEDNTDFCPHYHFDNDPLWFMTFLIYLSTLHAVLCPLNFACNNSFRVNDSLCFLLIYIDRVFLKES